MVCESSFVPMSKNLTKQKLRMKIECRYKELIISLFLGVFIFLQPGSYVHSDFQSVLCTSVCVARSSNNERFHVLRIPLQF